MNTFRKIALTSVMIAVGTAGLAHAADYSAMRKDKRTHNELLGASIAYLIDENCSSLRLRKLRLLNRAFSLRKHAVSLGYSTREVMDYVDSKREQDRFRALAEPILAKKGAKRGNEASYCAVGYKEMNKGTFAGSLLTKG